MRCRTSAYDVVRQHAMSYVSMRCRMSAYDVVRQHTMSYFSIRCRIRYGNMLETAWALRAGGGGDLTKKSVQAFLVRMLEASEARSSVILDVLEGLKENDVTWTDSTRDQRAACTVHASARPRARAVRMRAVRACTRTHARARMHARACTPRTPRAPRAHACMSRGGSARRGRVHTCDVVLHRSRKSHHLLHDRVIATNDWSSVCNVEQLFLDSVDNFIRCRTEEIHDDFSDSIAVLLRSLILSLLN